MMLVGTHALIWCIPCEIGTSQPGAPPALYDWFGSITTCVVSSFGGNVLMPIAESRQRTWLWYVWTALLAHCEVTKPSVVKEFILVIFNVCKLFEVELIAQNSSYTTKALDELVALTGAVRDELESRTEVVVFLGEPF